MNWFKRLFSALANYFRSGKAASDAEKALEYAQKALPVVSRVVDLVTTLTPTPADNAAWALIKAKYPSLLDGKQHTEDEIKLTALAVAADLFVAEFPGLDTSVARMAVQAAYLDYRSIASE